MVDPTDHERAKVLFSYRTRVGEQGFPSELWWVPTHRHVISLRFGDCEGETLFPAGYDTRSFCECSACIYLTRAAQHQKKPSHRVAIVDPNSPRAEAPYNSVHAGILFTLYPSSYTND